MPILLFTGYMYRPTYIGPRPIFGRLMGCEMHTFIFRLKPYLLTQRLEVQDGEIPAINLHYSDTLDK